MDYSLFLSYISGAAALVASSIGAIFWLVRRENRRTNQQFGDLLNEQ